MTLGLTDCASGGALTSSSRATAPDSAEESLKANLQKCSSLNGSSRLSTNGELESAIVGQGHRAQPIARIVDEVEVLIVGVAKLQRVVADDHRAFAQMGCNQRERRASHRRPDVDEHEV